MNNKRETIIIAGGGTGGHIIPAVSIALELKEFDSIYIGSKYELNQENLLTLKYFLDITGIQRYVNSSLYQSSLPISFLKHILNQEK